MDEKETVNDASFFVEKYVEDVSQDVRKELSIRNTPSGGSRI